MRYLEVAPVLVRGPASGRQYRFSGQQPLQSIVASDAALLRNGRLFRKA